MASRTFAPRSNNGRSRKQNRTPSCAYCKESGHWMRDRRANKILCPRLVQKQARAEAARIKRREENQLIKKALNSGEWLTYERGAPTYKPTQKELRRAAGLDQDNRPVLSYANPRAVDENNPFAALDSDSSDDEEVIQEPSRIVVNSTTSTKLRQEIARVEALIEAGEKEVQQLKAAKKTYWAEMSDLGDLEQELEELQEELANFSD